MNNRSGRRVVHKESLLEATMIYLRRTTTIGLLGAVLIGGACTASPDNTESKGAQPTEVEMIEVIIRLPDGRVITRQEPKYPSRIDPRHQVLNGDRPSVMDNNANKTSANGGKVNSTGSGTSGGSGGSSGGLTMAGGSASGGGGGGGGSSTGGGGGGGDSRGSTGGGGGGGGGGSSGGAPAGWVYNAPPSVPADNDYTVRMYAWENSGDPFQHVLTTYLADPRSKTPQRLAQAIATKVNRDQPEQIAIRFWKEMGPADRNPFDIENPRELIESGGYTAGLEEYWAEFARELAALGIRPDMLIHDYEKGIGFWHIPKEKRLSFFSTIMGNTGPLSTSLPESMRGVTVEQFMNYRDPAGTIALNDYNTFAAQFRASLLNRVFSKAFNDAYGEPIRISNYLDYNFTFETIHFTNRPSSGVTTGGISSPVAYMDRRNENAPGYAGTTKDQRWNRLISLLNRVRSASGSGLVIPWVSSPGYGIRGANTWALPHELPGEYRIWELMMDHMLAMGVDTFILWNPGPRFNPNARSTDGFIDNWLRDHPRGSGPQLGNLTAIPLDADQIETNGVVTTYEQFIEAMNYR